MTDFDKAAQGYDTPARIRRAEAVAAKIAFFVSDGAKKAAMEYGCGTGLVGFLLLDKFDSLLFMDSSAGMIEQVEKKLSFAENGGKATALIGDLSESFSLDLRFDYIFTSLSLHHIKDVGTVLRRFYGLLNSGGRLLIVDLDEDDGSFHAAEPDFDGHNGFDQSALAGLCLSAGFEQARSETFFRGVKSGSPYSLFILSAEKQ